MNVPELDREDFRLWLAAKEPDEVAHENTAECTFDHYFSERTGERWNVGIESAFGPRTVLLLPPWIRSVIQHLDAYYFGQALRDRPRPLTAKEVLTIFDSVEVAP